MPVEYTQQRMKFDLPIPADSPVGQKYLDALKVFPEGGLGLQDLLNSVVLETVEKTLDGVLSGEIS